MALPGFRACAKISSQRWHSDLVQIWPIRLSKTADIASYFEDFVNEASVKDGLKLKCQNVKLFVREPLNTQVPELVTGTCGNIYLGYFGRGFD